MSKDSERYIEIKPGVCIVTCFLTMLVTEPRDI